MRASGEEVLSCTVITYGPNETMGEQHDRMPVILDAADWPKWLGEDPVTADSDDCGRVIRLNAATRSDRRRPPFPMKATGLHCRHDELGQGLLAASRLVR